MNKTEGLLRGLQTDTLSFLNYMRAKVPVFHNSNIFYRDVENGVKGFFEKKGTPIKNSDASVVTKNYLEHLENEKVLIKTSEQSWKVNYPDFVTTKPGDPF